MGCITDRVCTYVGCITIFRVSIVFLYIHVQFRYGLITNKSYRLGTGQWYRLIQLYNNISHSDRLIVDEARIGGCSHLPVVAGEHRVL